MRIVGGLDVHRRQITFDYLDERSGQSRRGRIAPADRMLLLSQENDAKTSLADLFDKFVRPDLRAGRFGNYIVDGCFELLRRHL